MRWPSFLPVWRALLLGVFLAAVHTYKNTYSKNFILTLILLPAIVQSVILLVNGNVGTGVAVMGAFSLVRFRSAPGNSAERSSSIFLAIRVDGSGSRNWLYRHCCSDDSGDRYCNGGSSFSSNGKSFPE